MATQYVDKDDVKANIGLSGTSQDNNLDRAIDAACRLIDNYCGRVFYETTTTTVKYFTPYHEDYLLVDDIARTTDLVVQLDTTDDGTYDTTLTEGTDFYLLPVNPEINKITDGITYYEPYTQIRILTTRSSERFDVNIVKNVKITAYWGYSKIPDPIVEATLIQAIRLWKRKDSPFNVFGNEATGVVQLFNRMDPDAKELIKKYRKYKL